MNPENPQPFQPYNPTPPTPDGGPGDVPNLPQQPANVPVNPPDLPSSNAAEVGQQIMDGHTPRINPSDIPSTPSDAARIAERNLAGEPAPIDPASITKPGETPSEAAQVADRAVGGSGQSIFNQVPVAVVKRGSRFFIWVAIGVTVTAIVVIGGYYVIKYVGPKSSDSASTKGNSQTIGSSSDSSALGCDKSVSKVSDITKDLVSTDMITYTSLFPKQAKKSEYANSVDYCLPNISSIRFDPIGSGTNYYKDEDNASTLEAGLQDFYNNYFAPDGKYGTQLHATQILPITKVSRGIYIFGMETTDGTEPNNMSYADNYFIYVFPTEKPALASHENWQMLISLLTQNAKKGTYNADTEKLVVEIAKSVKVDRPY